MTKTVTEVQAEQCSAEFTRAASSKEDVVGVTVKAYAGTATEAVEQAFAAFKKACDMVG